MGSPTVALSPVDRAITLEASYLGKKDTLAIWTSRAEPSTNVTCGAPGPADLPFPEFAGTGTTVVLCSRSHLSNCFSAYNCISQLHREVKMGSNYRSPHLPRPDLADVLSAEVVHIVLWKLRRSAGSADALASAKQAISALKTVPGPEVVSHNRDVAHRVH